jgi:SprT protein
LSRIHLQEVLAKYIPTAAVEVLSGWIIEYRIKIKITKTRSTKLGDFRPAHQGIEPLITINHDLNKYSFLITLVHELAHLKAWQKHKNKVAPHGKEWKDEYKYLMSFFLNTPIFPHDINLALTRYMTNPAAASCSDMDLLRVLRKYNKIKDEKLHLEDTPETCIFKLENGRIFKKGEKRRTRFLCVELATKRKYTVSALAEVTLMEEPDNS